MSDQEHAETALVALERIERAEQDENVRDAHQHEIAAADELVGLLADGKSEEIDIGAPDGRDGEEEWKERVDNARDEGDVPARKGTLTTKTTDEREHYYLQWREGERVTSQYVAPISPA